MFTIHPTSYCAMWYRCCQGHHNDIFSWNVAERWKCILFKTVLLQFSWLDRRPGQILYKRHVLNKSFIFYLVVLSETWMSLSGAKQRVFLKTFELIAYWMRISVSHTFVRLQDAWLKTCLWQCLLSLASKSRTKTRDGALIWTTDYIITILVWFLPSFLFHDVSNMLCCIVAEGLIGHWTQSFPYLICI